MVRIDSINAKDNAVARQIHELSALAHAQESAALGIPDRPLGEGVRTVAHIQHSNELFLGAMAQGQLIGTLSLGPDDEANQIAIATLLVHPAHQRQGLGSLLVAAALQRAQGYTLSVAAGLRNTAAIQLYERLGFVQYRRGLLGPDNIPFVKLRVTAVGLVSPQPSPRSLRSRAFAPDPSPQSVRPPGRSSTAVPTRSALGADTRSTRPCHMP